MLFAIFSYFNFLYALLSSMIEADLLVNDIIIKEGIINESEVSNATKLKFSSECCNEEIKILQFWESSDKTKLENLKFSYVTNNNECILEKCLNILKEANIRGKKLLRLSIDVIKLTRNHLNIISELKFIEKFGLCFDILEEDSIFSLSNIGQSLTSFTIESKFAFNIVDTKKMTLIDCRCLVNLKHLFISSFKTD